ncbi:MAG: hypothetical protein ABI361_06830 [Nitrososphaera sp.]
MRRITFLIAVSAAAAAVAIIIVISLTYYSYQKVEFAITGISLSNIEFSAGSVGSLLNQGLNALSGNVTGSLESLIQSITVNLSFAISNRGVLPVYIPDFSYDLFINGIKIGEGKGSANLWISPGENKTIDIAQNLQGSSIKSTSESVIKSQGLMNVSANGTAQAQVLGISFPMPFNVSKQISLQNEVSKYLGQK